MCATKAKKPVKKTSETKKATTKTSAPKAKEAKGKKVAVKEAPAKKKPESKSAPSKAVEKTKKAVEKTKKVVEKTKKVVVSKPEIEPKKETKPKKVKSSSSKKPKADAKKEAIEVSTNPMQSLAFAFAEARKNQQLEAERKAAEERIVIKPGRRPTTRQKGVDTQKFPDPDLKAFRDILMSLRQQAIGQSHTLKENALEQTEDRSREDDDGSDVTIRLQNLSQVDVKSKDIQKIDEALRRIDNGTYGICEECGQLIRKQRLMSMPTAHHCIECQQKIEKSGR